MERVQDVIRELGLEKCADSFIGGGTVWCSTPPSPPPLAHGPQRRGISGGERRRVSMAVELVTKPTLIFLDEPTSGLDSTTAYRVVATVKRLAQKSRTVIMTIHQPKAKIFNMFDKARAAVPRRPPRIAATPLPPSCSLRTQWA
jgi:ABC-type glutathione transport system ATPase component